jgi:uncharacterized membrane protein YfcA
MLGTWILGALLSLLIGVSLGLLGGGGSILTVPILVYVLGLEAHQAIATSLLVVGITSVVALWSHARGGRVRFRTGLIFGASSMVGAFLAGRIAHLLPPALLLSLFGLMMLVTAGAMLRRRSSSMPSEPAPPTEVRARIPKIVVEGLVVGAITGLVGAGGGFLVVPALALLGGLSMRDAIGTSLLVIAMKSGAAFAGYLGTTEVPWGLASLVTSAAVVGSFVGARWAGKLNETTLRKAFAGFVVVMGIFVMAKEVPKMFGGQRPSSADHASGG